MTNERQQTGSGKPNQEEDAQNETLTRFPDLAPTPDLPEPPKVSVTLPPHPDKPRPGTIEPGSYRQTALGYSAVSSFVMPIIVTSVAGYLLDLKLHHVTYWCSMIGVVLGFIVGIVSLMRTLNKMNE